MDITQRIAAIIRAVDGDHTMGAAALAEAIVSELDLRESTAYGYLNESGFLYVGAEPGEHYVHYISKWMPA